MKRLLALISGWVARREPGTSLALFRIGLGLCVLYVTLPMMALGVQHLVLTDVASGGYREIKGDWLVGLLGGPTREGVDRLCWLTTGAGLLVALGLGGRVSALLALFSCVSLFRLSPEAGGGHDRLLTNGLWLTALAESTATLSLDCLVRTRRLVSERLVAAWPRYLAVFQLVVMYTATGMQKVGVDWMPWGGFKAVYKALLMPSWMRFDMDWLGPFFPLTQVASVLTLVFEWGAGVWLLAAWYRDTRDRPGRLRAQFNRLDLRLVWALMGVCMHAGIHLFMNVGPFSYVTLSFYACLWHPDEWARAGRRVLGWVGGRAREAQTSP